MDVIVPKTYHHDSVLTQEIGAHGIVRASRVCRVLSTIDLDRQADARTIKIKDVWSETVLAPELESGEPLFSQIQPQDFFGIGLIFAQVSPQRFGGLVIPQEVHDARANTEMLAPVNNKYHPLPPLTLRGGVHYRCFFFSKSALCRKVGGMKEKLEQLKSQATAAFKAAKNSAELEALEIRFLGRKGEMNALMQGMAGLPGHERPAMGKLANEVKLSIERTLAERRRELETEALGALAKTEWMDVTLPGARPPEGHLHLVSDAITEITDLFGRLGFTRVRYPEVEWDWYAFESLNMPKDHPARDEWETFFIDAPEDKKLGKMVLTPHTSSGQAREMEKGKLPIRMINISKTYRRQSDVTHVPMFQQFEGLMIDRHVAVTHLKGVLDYFARSFFGAGRKTRLRPFHFRFTEPSFEIDVTCGVCGGTGEISNGVKCRVCKEGWLELGGAGMVHPNVLKAGGVDPEKWSGFAFGWGVERTMAMKEGMQIDDVRLLYKNDFRFLTQF